MAEGFGVYGAGLANRTNTVSLGVGSSFAAPNVAGIAALLWEDLGASSDSFSATQIRNAIVESGDPSIIKGGDTVDDQGNGWVNAAQALSNLTRSLSGISFGERRTNSLRGFNGL